MRFNTKESNKEQRVYDISRTRKERVLSTERMNADRVQRVSRLDIY